jgi:YD repeat-containing protein
LEAITVATAGNLIQVTDPNGNETTYVFDDFGEMIRQESPVTGVTTYAYDLAGNLLNTTDANGATTTRSYDALGRALSAVSERGGGSESIAWGYDENAFGIGRLATMTDPTGGTNYRYERRGLLLREEKTIGSTGYVTAFGYDEDGNRARMIYPSRRIVDYTFDYADRPYSVTAGSTPIVTSAGVDPVSWTPEDQGEPRCQDEPINPTPKNSNRS